MTIKDYMELPYNINIRHIRDESGEYYFATVNELDGCMSDGKTIEEAAKNIRKAMESWLETCLEKKYKVPVPENDVEKFSGKFNVRLPKSLHGEVVTNAKNEGVSLNQYIVYALARQVGGTRP